MLKNKRNLNFVIFIKRKCIKATSSLKTKKVTKRFQKKNIIFFMLFLNIYTGLDDFIRITHVNWIHKVWVHLINERQPETHGLLDKKKEFHGINLLPGQWVHPENYNCLNPTQLLDLCCCDLCSSTYPFQLWIYAVV